MFICKKCNAQLEEGSNFCTYCGIKVDANSENNTVFMDDEFARLTHRYRCSCGYVFDGNQSTENCPKCHNKLSKQGIIQMYRKGNFMGMAVGMGIYIDNEPFGHIANKQSIRISVPFGDHKIHVTHTSTRTCNDPIISVSSSKPVAYTKASFGAAGFVINVVETQANDMPK